MYIHVNHSQVLVTRRGLAIPIVGALPLLPPQLLDLLWIWYRPTVQRDQGSAARSPISQSSSTPWSRPSPTPDPPVSRPKQPANPIAGLRVF